MAVLRQLGKQEPIEQVGLYFGLSTASAAAICAMIGGRLADKLLKLDPRWVLRFPAIAMIAVFPLLCLFLYFDDYRIAIVFLFIAWAILTMGYIPIFAAVQAVAGPTGDCGGFPFCVNHADRQWPRPGSHRRHQRPAGRKLGCGLTTLQYDDHHDTVALVGPAFLASTPHYSGRF